MTSNQQLDYTGVTLVKYDFESGRHFQISLMKLIQQPSNPPYPFLQFCRG